MIGSQWSLDDIQPQWQYKQGEGMETNAATDLNKPSLRGPHDGTRIELFWKTCHAQAHDVMISPIFVLFTS